LPIDFFVQYAIIYNIMNNIIFQSIRAIAVLTIALFAFVGDVLAAPMLTPVTAKYVTENNATIVGHVSNPQKNSTVWFEIYNNNNAPTAVAVQGIWDEGTFEWNIRDLNPGQTYSYRSVAMGGGATVYSPVSSFTTLVPKQTSLTVTYQSNSHVVTPAPKVNQTVEPVVAVKKTTTTTPFVTEDGFTNKNTAAVIGPGSGIFPTTLIGWVALIIAILSATLIGRIIYESTEKRKKEDEEEDNEEVETE